MIRSDRRIVAAVLKLTNNYHDELMYCSDTRKLCIVQNFHDIIKSVPIKGDADDVSESLKRLSGIGWLRVESKWLGGYTFCMTSLMKHRRAFWLDSFTKRFWGGFIAGVLTAAAANLISSYALSALSKVFQLLANLL